MKYLRQMSQVTLIFRSLCIIPKQAQQIWGGRRSDIQVMEKGCADGARR